MDRVKIDFFVMGQINYWEINKKSSSRCLKKRQHEQMVESLVNLKCSFLLKSTTCVRVCVCPLFGLSCKDDAWFTRIIYWILTFLYSRARERHLWAEFGWQLHLHLTDELFGGGILLTVQWSIAKSKSLGFFLKWIEISSRTRSLNEHKKSNN